METPQCPLERGHWIRPTVNTYCPTRIMTLTADYDSVIGSDANEVVLRRWHLCEVRRRGLKWSDEKEVCGETTAGLWEHIRDRGKDSPRLYILGEDGGAMLAPLGFWREVEAERLSLQLSADQIAGKQRPLPLIMSDTCDIIGARWESGSLRFTAPHNYSLDYASPGITPRSTDTDESCRGRGRELMAKFRKLCEWWLTLECGPWADTTAGLGYSWWKKTLGKQDVLQHDNEHAHALECQSVYGGFRGTFYHGRVIAKGYRIPEHHNPPKPLKPVTIQSEAYHLDIRSMYVSLMRDREFPVEILGPLSAVTPTVLDKVLELQEVTAKVWVRNESGNLPYRHQRGIIYPRGEFETVLTTPELRLAIERGELLRVIEGTRYRRGRPLRQYAEEVLRMRELAKLCNDPIGERLAKACGNAMSGRLARKQSRWVNDPKKDGIERWGEWQYYPDEDTLPLQCRSIAGRGQVWEEDGRRIAGLTAIYATLTAYGRVEADRILSAAGRISCLSWDTDGGWFTRTGYETLCEFGEIVDESPGKLRHVRTAKAAMWRTPKHHWIDGEYTLSGIPGGFAVDRSGRVTWQVHTNPAAQALDPERHPSSIYDSHAEYSQFGSGVPINSQGWAETLRVVHGVVVVDSSGKTIG